MAGLFLLHDTNPDRTASALGDARAQFARHGFGTPREIDLSGWRLLHFPPIVGGPDTMFVRPADAGDDIVAVAGSIVVDGLVGTPALERLLDMPFPAIDWSRIDGQFVAIVRARGRLFVFTDYFAAFQIFHDTDHGVFSTSLLAALGALPRVRFDPQGLYEFAFNVVPIGDDTIFADLKTLGPDRILELSSPDARGRMIAHAVARTPKTTAAAIPLAERIDRARSVLTDAVRAQVRHFGDRIHTPLSGGLDSRLVLAGLRDAGSNPDVYVYGPAGSPDVTIARDIGATMGFPVNWINKFERDRIERDAFPALVARNFEEEDALPNYGNIFDDGGNALARDARHADGWLAASGGCGEIYRNFFYLADRPITAAAVARTFFARYTVRDVTTAFDERRFIESLRDKILAAIGRDGDLEPIPRALVEHIYPRIRCRAVFGREISMEARRGAYFMPFLNHHVVDEAMTLPVSLKNAGRFEAMVLNAIDPELARQPSAYGHSFAEPPSWRHVASEWSTRVRPTWLRQRSYALQRRLRPMADEHGAALDPAYMQTVIDPEMPAMRRYFQVDAITDSGLWRRLACLEYLAARLGTKLVQ